MKTAKMLTILVVALGLILCSAKVSEAAEMGTAFTYQGHLSDANEVADGLYDFQFKLYDDPCDPCDANQVGTDVNKPDVDVIDGYFTVELDFGSDVFDGNAVWLETRVVESPLGSDPCTLSPRLELTPVPYALHTRGVFLGQDNTFVGIEAGANTTTGIYNTFLGNSAGHSNTTGNSNTFLGREAGYSNTEGSWNTFLGWHAGYYNTEGGDNIFLGFGAGYSNTEGNRNTFLGSEVGVSNRTGAGNVFIGYEAGFYETGSNKLYIANSDVNTLIYGDFSTGNVGIGTTNPEAKLTVNGAILRSGSTMYGTEANTHINLGTTSTTGWGVLNALYCTVGGGQSNTATGNYATVGGGQSNYATGNYATVGGGDDNTANNSWATVGGGQNNTASGMAATVGGGDDNTANNWRATVGGGDDNTASGDYATVGGGYCNDATGSYATVPGGFGNVAGGDYSFAAGYRAKVRDAAQAGDSDGDEGTFVWADSTNADFKSTGPDQFLIRASGGVGIGTTNPDAKLEVNGEIKITDGSQAAGKVLTSDASGLASWQTPAAGDSDWTISDSNMYSGVSGNVGIGTTSPTHKLVINTDEDLDGIYLNDLDGTTKARLLRSFGGWAYFQLNDASGINRVQLNSNGNSYFNGGKVGIGTASPGAKLEVNGQVKITGGSPGANKVLTSDATGLGSWQSPTAGDSDWIISGNNMYSAVSGNVGIGTTSPSEELEVNGTVKADTFVGDGSGLTNLPADTDWNESGGNVYRTTGNVGVGTSSPIANLEIFENTDGWVGMHINNPNTGSDSKEGIYFKNEDGVVAGIMVYDDDNPVYPSRMTLFNNRPGGSIALATSGVRSIVVDNLGRVGIKRDPTANALEVSGFASKTSAGHWLANSDVRIKTDIETVTNPLETLDKVRLVSFKYSDDYQAEHPSIEQRRYLNVIAQEFREVFPDYVKSSKEKLPNGDEILQVDAYPLTVYSAAAVQELHVIVKEKDAELEDLRERLSKMETLVGELVRRQEGGGQ